jgi:hypothetical protein
MQLTIISFPRSGQHLTERLLTFYCKKQKIKFSYCEFYNHCKNTPCKDGRLFQKNHDFDLKLPIDASNRYLVLYRSNMIEQLEAYFRYELRANWGLQHTSVKINYNNIEKRLSLQRFMESKSQYYFGFVKKWVMCDYRNVFKLEYASLVKDPNIYLLAFKHLFPNLNHSKDRKILSDFRKAEPIKRQNEVDLDFNHPI